MNFLILAFLFISALATDDAKENGPQKDKDLIDGGSFDYVIVGAGPGASLAATELSKTSSVLMLETGPFSSTIPKVWQAQTWLDLQQDPTIEYGYLTNPQTNLAPGNQILTIARAKMTGGCGAHNGMIYELGNKYDYNGWAEAGNPSWKWENIAPIWNEIDNQIPESTIERSTFYSEMAAVLEEDGYRYLENPNRGNNMGYHLHRFMAKKINNTYARRMTAYEIFIDSVIAKRNKLNVLVYTRVEKIVFQGKRATGVIAKNIGTGKRYSFTAKKEVIVAGGVVETPKLLMLSGIGPAATLNKFNIPVLVNAPGVGKNFRDHLFYPVFGPELKNQQTPIPQPIFSDSGYITMGPDDGTPAGSKPRMYSSLFVSDNFVNGKRGFGGWVEALNMKSVGYVTLSSANPEDLPIIQPNYLQDPHDVKEIVFGIRQVRKWLANPKLTAFTKPVEEEIFPGFTLQTDEQLEANIRASVVSDFHPCGTCKMGPASDPDAVVDEFGRVRGVSKLRILDSSIFPTLVSGNPNQPTMITGLKGARAILNGN